MAAGETAGPSTTLRSGRDDNSVAGSTTVSSHRFRSLQNCHPEPERTRISYFALLATSTCAALLKESRM
jgi:hypothetical protein